MTIHLYAWMFVFFIHLLELFPRNEITELEVMKNIKALNQITQLLFQEDYVSLKSLWQCMKSACFTSSLLSCVCFTSSCIKNVFLSLHPCYLCKLGYQVFKDFLIDKWKIIHHYISLVTREAEKFLYTFFSFFFFCKWSVHVLCHLHNKKQSLPSHLSIHQRKTLF